MSSNYSMFGMPNDVKFCTKCVISNQRPNSTIEFLAKDTAKKTGIKINDKFVCSACKYNDEKNIIDWKEREKELIELCKKHKRKSGYDVVIPGSGGKDSGYTAHILKYKYGLNPLTVTWAPHLYTEIGRKNFDNWIKIGGFDNILFTPNGKLHRLLTKLAFKNLLHPFQPFIIGQKIIGPLIASKFKIPLIFYGENPSEYGNNPEDNKLPIMDKKFFSLTNLDNIYLGGLKIREIIEKYKFTLNDFQPYLPLENEKIDQNNIEVHHLGYYLKWDQQNAYYYSVDNTGFKPNLERTEGTYSKYVSLDDKIDRFHFYTYFIKFGIGQATYDASQEIRCGKISREEGVMLVKKFDSEFPKKYFKEFLEYINLNESEFWETINRFRSPHLWAFDNKNQNWNLKKKVFD